MYYPYYAKYREILFALLGDSAITIISIGRVWNKSRNVSGKYKMFDKAKHWNISFKIGQILMFLFVWKISVKFYNIEFYRENVYVRIFKQ